MNSEFGKSYNKLDPKVKLWFKRLYIIAFNVYAWYWLYRQIFVLQSSDFESYLIWFFTTAGMYYFVIDSKGVFFPTKPIKITNSSEFKSVLSRLIQHLQNNNFNAHASVVLELLESLSNNNESGFLQKLNGIDMWGGSGSVWELGGFRTDEDEKIFQELIVELTDQMKAIGIKNRAAYSVARLFRSELKNHK